MSSEKQRKLLFYLINGLTIFRLILTPIILILIFSGFRFQAFFVFLIAVLTDLLDGDLARRHNVVSEIGGILDSIADLSLVYSAVIPIFVLGEFSRPIEIAIFIATFLAFVVILEHSIKNKKLTLPSRRPSSTINSYFVYTNLALFIIDSPYKFPMVYLTFFIIAVTAFDYFINPKIEK